MQLTSGGLNGALRAPSSMRRLQLILVLSGRIDVPTEVVKPETDYTPATRRGAVDFPSLTRAGRRAPVWRRLLLKVLTLLGLVTLCWLAYVWWWISQHGLH